MCVYEGVELQGNKLRRVVSQKHTSFIYFYLEWKQQVGGPPARAVSLFAGEMTRLGRGGGAKMGSFRGWLDQARIIG